MRWPKHKIFSFLLLILLPFFHISTQASDPPTPCFKLLVDGNSFTGKVVGISDGDTISVMRKAKAVNVRLPGIDCPKWGQPFGIWAEKFTSDLTFGKEVEVRVHDTDRCGRVVAEVILPNGKNLSYELVGTGMAWWYRTDFPDNSILGMLEWVAQVGRLGQWADENPIPPWKWRKMQRGRRKK